MNNQHSNNDNDDNNQCHAPAQSGFQCMNVIAIGKNSHCDLHHEKAKKLYEDYKKICYLANMPEYNAKKFKTLPTLKEKLSFVQKCYLINSRAYDLRMKHRKFAFVPKYYDFGHNYQFERLLKRIKTCETYLQLLYQKLIAKNKQTLAKEEQILIKNVLIEEETVVFQKIESFRQKRQQDLNETARLLTQYVTENKQPLQEKKELIENLVQKVTYFIKNATQHEIFIVLKVIHSLKNWNYFGNDIKLPQVIFHKCVLPCRKYTTIFNWIQANMEDNQISDFVLLIDMYQLRISNAIGNWKQSHDVAFCPVLMYDTDAHCHMLNMPKTSLHEQYLSISKLSDGKLNSNPVCIYNQYKNIAKLGKCNVRFDNFVDLDSPIVRQMMSPW